MAFSMCHNYNVIHPNAIQLLERERTRSHKPQDTSVQSPPSTSRRKQGAVILKFLKLAKYGYQLIGRGQQHPTQGSPRSQYHSTQSVSSSRTRTGAKTSIMFLNLMSLFIDNTSRSYRPPQQRQAGTRKELLPLETYK